jgi:F0F1-type ATP synthase membrane subunit b/b'
MGLFSRIAKSIESGKIEARRDAASAEASRAETRATMSNFESKRGECLDQADACRREGDHELAEKYERKAENYEKGIRDAGRRLYGS